MQLFHKKKSKKKQKNKKFVANVAVHDHGIENGDRNRNRNRNRNRDIVTATDINTDTNTDITATLKKPESLWPCVLNTRMPSYMANAKKSFAAAQALALETKVFIEPYRPDLLPVYLQKNWDNGGMWLDPKLVQFFPLFDDNSNVDGDCDCDGDGNGDGNNSNNSNNGNNGNNETTTMESFSIFPQGFKHAYLHAKRDTSVPGTLKHDCIFDQGSLVKQQYRTIHSSANNNNSSGNSNKKGSNNSDTNNIQNRLISSLEMSIWNNTLVQLHALDKIISINTNDDKKRKSSYSKYAAKSKRSSDYSVADSNGGLTEDDAISCAIAASLQATSSLASVGNGDGDGNAMVSHAAAGDIPIDTHIGRNNRPQHAFAYGPGDSAMPPGIEIHDSVYPGYGSRNGIGNWNGNEITKSAVTGKWIATVYIRGNEVQLGQFPSQTAAKNEIDLHHASKEWRMKRMEKTPSKGVNSKELRSQKGTGIGSTNAIATGDDDLDSSDDEFDVLVKKRQRYNSKESNLKSGPRSGSGVLARMKSNSRVRNEIVDDYSKDSKDQDVEAINVEKAVSLAYRDGHIKDTGFSIHEWALVVVKDSDKAKWRGMFHEMKQNRIEKKRKVVSKRKV